MGSLSQKITPPLKWHGGKHYMASSIIELMPSHTHYVEPYAGGLSVLLRKDPMGVSEVVNDLNHQLINFWRVLQKEDTFQQFQRLVEATPFSQVEWEEARLRQAQVHVPNAQDAVAFFVRCRQSRTGGFDCFATLSRNRTRRGMNEQASAWWNCIEGLSAVRDRLKRVVILCQDALTVIRSQDGPNTLFYLDPPYMHETRASNDNYAHEMTRADHEKMIGTVKQCQGKVILSGYPNDLYNDVLHTWSCHDRLIDNKVAGGATKRIMVESLWCNF